MRIVIHESGEVIKLCSGLLNIHTYTPLLRVGDRDGNLATAINNLVKRLKTFPTTSNFVVISKLEWRKPEVVEAATQCNASLFSDKLPPSPS